MDNLKLFLKRSYLFYLIVCFLKFIKIKSIFGKPIVFINYFRLFHERNSFLYFSPGSIEASEFFFDGISGSRENTSLLLFSHLSKNSKYILDIGAFHGLFTFLSTSWSQSGKLLQWFLNRSNRVLVTFD